MCRRTTEDMPSYATDAAASTQLSGSHLVASGGLFLALLAVMSVVEAPIRKARGEPIGARAASVPSACAGTQILTSRPAGSAPAPAG